MPGPRKKPPRDKTLTARFLDGGMDEDREDKEERYDHRVAGAQKKKMEETAVLRAGAEHLSVDLDALPTGQVIQIYSLFCEVESAGQTWLCVVRKTMAKLSATALVSGDHVRFRSTGNTHESGRPEAVIEQVLPRRTILTRSDSFKAIDAQPIVANADQVLIVAAVLEPRVKWGLIDRMIVAAQAGGLTPIICLNKVDLAATGDAAESLQDARQVLAHYDSMKIPTLETSVPEERNLDLLRDILRNKTTILAGHSGVGKSSLICSIQPKLDLRVGAISNYTGKGRHTTTSARRFDLDFGGQVVDTPGVKLFGLWGVTADNLDTFFPDILAGNAPPWRKDSYERIRESLLPQQ